MTRSRLALAGVLVVLVAVLAACAAGPNDVSNAGIAQVAGFWQGVWHGLIIPVTFIVSLFNAHVSIYEVHNDGNWYDFGFVLGLAILSSITQAPRVASRAR
jgi:hypothetical protein